METQLLSSLSGRFKIRQFPGKLEPQEWTRLARLKFLRINVPPEAFWYRVPLDDTHRQLLKLSKEEFVNRVLKDESSRHIYEQWITDVWPSHQDLNTGDNFESYLGLYHDLIMYAKICPKILMNAIDNETKQLIIAENEDCDLAWMLERLENTKPKDTNTNNNHSNTNVSEVEEYDEETRKEEKLTENTPEQPKYDKMVLKVINDLNALTVELDDRFMSLYESRFRVWAYCQYTVRKFYELTRRLVTIAYVPGDNTKHPIRHDVYKCRSPGCQFLIEIKIDEKTTDLPIMMWYVSKIQPHSCILSQPTQDNLKLFREGQGMHLCRQMPTSNDHELMLRLCWNTLKYSMHIMKRQLRRAQLCVTEHETMFETPQSMASLAAYLSAYYEESDVQIEVGVCESTNNDEPLKKKQKQQ